MHIFFLTCKILNNTNEKYLTRCFFCLGYTELLPEIESIYKRNQPDCPPN